MALGFTGLDGDGLFYELSANGTVWIAQRPATAPAVAAAAPVPLPTAPHLQFSDTTNGATTLLAYGRCRLPGQYIWVAGIDASTSALDTSFLTFCAAYNEPIDPSESIRIQRMWANGTLFYDFDEGGVITVANMTDAAMTALRTCIDGIEFHPGGPGELPSPIMESYLGVGNVPAYRGLRTIVFVNFPLIISNNGVPNISVEFYRTDVTLINVSTCLDLLVERYLERNGLQRTASSLDNYFGFEVDGITDQCYGLVVSDLTTLLDKLAQYRAVFKFQLKDGQPVKLIKRPVNSDLVIDYSVTEADLIRRNGAPALTFARADPADLPVGVDLRYLDIDNNFDVSVAQSRHEGSGVSSTVASLSSDFITDATTARELSFDILYKDRAEGLRESFEIDDLTPEVSDVIEITTTNGDSFICLVEQQTQTKSRSSVIGALNLLTVAGADILGNNYRHAGRVVLLLNFPGADGSTIITDESPARHGNATIIGSAQVDTTYSKFGGSSGLFDGTSAVLNFADSADWNLSAVGSNRNGRFTVEAWIRPSNVASTGFIIAQWGDLFFFEDGVFRAWALFQDSAELVFSYSPNGISDIELLRGGTLVANAWNAVAVDYDGTTLRAYINGAVVDSAVISHLAIINGTNPLAVGGSSSNDNFFFNGSMDVVTITLNVAKYAGPYLIGNLGFLMEGSSTAQFLGESIGVFTSAGAANVAFGSSSTDDDAFLLLL